MVLSILKPFVLNKKALGIREVEEIRAIEEESDKEKEGNDRPTLVTLYVGESLLIKRFLHVTKAPHKDC